MPEKRHASPQSHAPARKQPAEDDAASQAAPASPPGSHPLEVPPTPPAGPSDLPQKRARRSSTPQADSLPEKSSGQHASSSLTSPTPIDWYTPAGEENQLSWWQQTTAPPQSLPSRLASPPTVRRHKDGSYESPGVLSQHQSLLSLQDFVILILHVKTGPFAITATPIPQPQSLPS